MLYSWIDPQFYEEKFELTTLFTMGSVHYFPQGLIQHVQYLIDIFFPWGFWKDLKLKAHSVPWPWQQQLLSTTYCKLQRNYILFWHKIFAPRKTATAVHNGLKVNSEGACSFFNILRFHEIFHQCLYMNEFDQKYRENNGCMKIIIILQENF